MEICVVDSYCLVIFHGFLCKIKIIHVWYSCERGLILFFVRCLLCVTFGIIYLLSYTSLCCTDVNDMNDEMFILCLCYGYVGENKLTHVWFHFEKGLIQVFFSCEWMSYLYLCVTLGVFLLYFYHIILLIFLFFLWFI